MKKIIISLIAISLTMLCASVLISCASHSNPNSHSEEKSVFIEHQEFGQDEMPVEHKNKVLKKKLVKKKIVQKRGS